VARLYPDTNWRERLTLRYFILPEMQKTIAARNAEIGRLLPFRASLAGATNGLDSLKYRLGLIPAGTVLAHSVFNSVPDLGGRLWRTKLLNSGTYAIPGIDHTMTIHRQDIDDAHRRSLAGIIAYFTVPSMGVTPEVAETSIEQAFWVTRWMQDYRPQAFPGHIDTSRLPEGRAVYAANCASCHGSYDDSLDAPALTSFPNWEGNVGTDPERARLLTQDIADAVNASFGRYINARTVSTYTAPPLTGIWESAPYFHNGSVPTLWHLIHPANRPTRFQVGGHKLDLEKIGIAGNPDAAGGWGVPNGYQPWSEPAEVDTTAFGLGNAGHEAEFAPLSDNQKAALLEYLKLL
jgi:mono/diheme cytochrome c family protein